MRPGVLLQRSAVRRVLCGRGVRCQWVGKRPSDVLCACHSRVLRQLLPLGRKSRGKTSLVVCQAWNLRIRVNCTLSTIIRCARALLVFFIKCRVSCPPRPLTTPCATALVGCVHRCAMVETPCLSAHCRECHCTIRVARSVCSAIATQSQVPAAPLPCSPPRRFRPLQKLEDPCPRREVPTAVRALHAASLVLIRPRSVCCARDARAGHAAVFLAGVHAAVRAKRSHLHRSTH